jgi:hypothetical protein
MPVCAAIVAKISGTSASNGVSSRTLCKQVRQLREELLAARRDRASGEAREAELRRELSSIKRQVRLAQAPTIALNRCIGCRVTQSTAGHRVCLRCATACVVCFHAA